MGEAVKIKILPADRWFSLCKRISADWKCERCKKQFKPGDKGLHCCHYFPRGPGYMASRWLPLNVGALCHGCHRWLDQGSHTQKMQYIMQRIGADGHGYVHKIYDQKIRVKIPQRAVIATFYRDLACTMKRGQIMPMSPTVRELINGE